MTNQKPKPLFPASVPSITLPVLSIEEPEDRVMPTPVPVVLPLRSVKGGTTYVAELLRILPIKVVYQILTQIPEERPYDLLKIATDYESWVSPPALSLNLGLRVEPMIYSVGIESLNPELALSVDSLVTISEIELIEKNLGLGVSAGMIPSLEVALVLPAGSRVEVELSSPEILQSILTKLETSVSVSSIGELIITKELRLARSYSTIPLVGTATKYDGYHEGDIVAMTGYKYDGYHEGDIVAMAGYKYDGYHQSSVAA